MLSFRKLLFVFVLCAATAAPAFAQAGISVLQPAAAPANSNHAPPDPLGRTTPASTILGFSKAASAGNYRIAAQYMQMSAAHRQSEGEQIASKLKFVLDNTFFENYNQYNQPEGIPQEGVPLGHQKLGSMSAGDVEVDLDLVRVNYAVWRL